MVKTTATQQAAIADLVASLGKPSIGQIVRLVQFLGSLFAEGGKAAKAMTGINAGAGDSALFGVILMTLSPGQLIEFGQILLQTDEVTITEDDLDLVWLTEALAVWAESCNLKQIIKNVQRVAAATR